MARAARTTSEALAASADTDKQDQSAKIDANAIEVSAMGSQGGGKK